MPLLDVWYNFLQNSGVNEEWCSIGTVLVALLCVMTIFKVFLGVTKLK